MDYQDLRESLRIHRDVPPIILANVGTTMKGAVDDLAKIREIIDDLAYGLPPLNMHLAREMMAQTRIYQRLRYSLLRRANLNAVALTLV